MVRSTGREKRQELARVGNPGGMVAVQLELLNHLRGFQLIDRVPRDSQNCAAFLGGSFQDSTGFVEQ